MVSRALLALTVLAVSAAVSACTDAVVPNLGSDHFALRADFDQK
jgi:hypothetical protein